MMNIRMETISPKAAREAKGFILPNVISSPDFDSYSFFGALTDGRLAGLIVSDPRIFEPVILSIGISPEYQDAGLATELLEYALLEMLRLYPAEELSIPNVFTAEVLGVKGFNKAICRVFEKCGFKPVKKGVFYEIPVSMIRDNHLIQNPSIITRLSSREGREGFAALKNIPDGRISEFSDYLSREEVVSGIFPKELDEDISFFELKDDEIHGCILFAKKAEGVIQNLLLYQRGGDALDRQRLLYLLTAASCAALKKHSGDTRISFHITGDVTEKILNKIFPEATPMEEAIIYELPFSDAVRLITGD